MAVFGTIHNVRISGIACAVPEKVIGNDFFVSRWGGYFGYDWGWSGSASGSRSALADDDEDYAMLIDMCGYYGLQPEQIRHLRDMGYSYDEIEEMLYDPECYGIALSGSEW